MEEESSANQETGPQYNDGPGSKYQYKTGLFVLWTVFDFGYYL